MENEIIRSMPDSVNDAIKVVFKKIVKAGKLKCVITGPKGNILDCETDEDWIEASHILMKAGFRAVSPGTYGGSDPFRRKKTYNDMYRSGKTCAVVISRRIMIFRVPGTYDLCHTISKAA